VNQYCNNAILSILGEEELSDVSLSTFYVFDKESAKSQLGDKVAAERACAARGCAVRYRRERNACVRRLNSRLTKKAAAGFSSDRCHETPLKAPREFKMLTARPRIRGQRALRLFRHLFLLRLLRRSSHDMIPSVR